MAEAAQDRRLYSKRHTWVEADRQTRVATVGVTEYLAEQLGQIVSMDFPYVNDELEQDKSCIQLHLEKRISSVRSPLSGRVTELNDEVEDNPGLLSLDPGKYWLYRMEYDDEDELDLLMGSARYARFLDQL